MSKIIKRINFVFWVMKTIRLNESQIIKGLEQHECGCKAEDIVRDLGISQGAFYKWKQKYGGIEASDVKCFKDLELENSYLLMPSLTKRS